MNNEQFVASLTQEQNAALLAFRDSLNAMYQSTVAGVASEHAGQLAVKDAQIAELEHELSNRVNYSAENERLTSELQAKQAELDAALARIDELENPPTVAWRLAPNDFVKRFTHEELIATQLSVDPIVILGRTDIQTIITFIDLKDPQTAMYVGRLVQLGILTEQRAAEVMAY